MDYPGLVAALEVYAQEVEPNTSADFIASIPVFIQNAELNIYRSLDFLSTREQNASLAFTAGSRSLDLGQLNMVSLALLTDTGSPLLTDTGVPILTTNTFIDTNISYPVVVQDIAAIVPAPDQPNVGKRIRFRPASLDWIDNVWPNEATTAVPTYDNAYFTMKTDQVVIVCPTPPAAYVAEITGTWRPAPMSATNPTTWLGTNVPDLLFIACMLEVSAWMRDFGATSGDPALAMTWTQRYEQAKASALEEENRRKGYGPGWQPMSPTPLAQPPR